MSTYTKIIKYKIFKYDSWIDQELRTTNDAVWIHLEQLQLRNDIKAIVVSDI